MREGTSNDQSHERKPASLRQHLQSNRHVVFVHAMLACSCWQASCRPVKGSFHRCGCQTHRRLRCAKSWRTQTLLWRPWAAALVRLQAATILDWLMLLAARPHIGSEQITDSAFSFSVKALLVAVLE